MTKRLVITGFAGFMGSHFHELVYKDSRYDVRPFIGDITRKEDCVRNLRDADIVINFAALTYLPPSWDAPEAYTSINYQGVVNLLQCHEMFSRFIQISTSHVYGNQTKIPIDIHTNEPHPHDPYSIAKFAAERAVVGYAERYGFDYLILRAFNNFGPRQSKHFVIPTFCLQALQNNHIVVRGDTSREFVYVKDNVRAIKWFLDNKSVGYRQVCRGVAYRISWVAEKIAWIIGNGCKFSVEESRRKHDIQALWGVPTLPPDFKFTPIDVALGETTNYYRSLAYMPNTKQPLVA